MQYASKKEEYSRAWQLIKTWKNADSRRRKVTNKTTIITVLLLCFALFSLRDLYLINSAQPALPINPKIIHTQVRKRSSK